MTRFTRTLVLAAASVGIVAAAAASSGPANAAAPQLDARTVKIARETAAVASWAKSQGLAGLSPASLHPVAAVASTQQYPRDVFSVIP